MILKINTSTKDLVLKNHYLPQQLGKGILPILARVRPYIVKNMFR
jgi:hypothetical protein